MASILSQEIVRGGRIRVVWQWTDVNGKVFGPNVSHIPAGSDVQAFANAAEAENLAALAAAEADANLNDILNG